MLSQVFFPHGRMSWLGGLSLIVVIHPQPLSMFRNTTCKYCSSDKHTSLQCFLRPHAPMRRESIKSQLRRLEVRDQWFKLNPPNKKGQWRCYLQISMLCPKYLDKRSLVLEHVKSRARHPDLKYDVNNLKPSCKYCNEAKGSKDVSEVKRS